MENDIIWRTTGKSKKDGAIGSYEKKEQCQIRSSQRRVGRARGQESNELVHEKIDTREWGKNGIKRWIIKTELFY